MSERMLRSVASIRITQPTFAVHQARSRMIVAVCIAISLLLVSAEGAMATSAVNDNNYAGYTNDVHINPDVVEVQASWIVPTLYCNATPNADVSIWVGMDAGSDYSDTGSADIEQPGIDGRCKDGQPEWQAVYEMFPANPVEAGYTSSIYPISSGDFIWARVMAPGPYGTFETEVWELLVKDVTKKWEWRTRVTDQQVSEEASQQLGYAYTFHPLQVDADWIVESPELKSLFSASTAQLAWFSPIRIFDATMRSNGSNDQIGGGTPQPNGVAPVSYSIQQSGPEEWAYPSAWSSPAPGLPGGPDSEFTVTYGQPAPVVAHKCVTVAGKSICPG
jgi:hypothetical protein